MESPARCNFRIAKRLLSTRTPWGEAPLLAFFHRATQLLRQLHHAPHLEIILTRDHRSLQDPLHLEHPPLAQAEGVNHPLVALPRFAGVNPPFEILICGEHFCLPPARRPYRFRQWYFG